MSKRKNKQNIYLFGALAGLLLFGATAALAFNDQLSLLEQQLFALFFDLPLTLRPVFLVITQFGNGWMVLVAAVVAYLARYCWLARNFLVTGITTYLLVVVAKELVGRPRPMFLLPDIIHRDLFVSGLGFPSGHTAVATALSLTLLPYLPRKYYFVVPLWIVAVGFSRLYLGVHAPLDIIGGFGIGLFVACTFHFIAARRPKSA